MEKATDAVSSVKENPTKTIISPDQRQLIIKAYKSLLEVESKVSLKRARKILSKELGIIETTISKAVLEYDRTKRVSSRSAKENSAVLTSGNSSSESN